MCQKKCRYCELRKSIQCRYDCIGCSHTTLDLNNHHKEVINTYYNVFQDQTVSFLRCLNCQHFWCQHCLSKMKDGTEIVIKGDKILEAEQKGFLDSVGDFLSKACAARYILSSHGKLMPCCEYRLNAEMIWGRKKVKDMVLEAKGSEWEESDEDCSRKVATKRQEQNYRKGKQTTRGNDHHKHQKLKSKLKHLEEASVANYLPASKRSKKHSRGLFGYYNEKGVLVIKKQDSISTLRQSFWNEIPEHRIITTAEQTEQKKLVEEGHMGSFVVDVHIMIPSMVRYKYLHHLAKQGVAKSRNQTSGRQHLVISQELAEKVIRKKWKPKNALEGFQEIELRRETVHDGEVQCPWSGKVHKETWMILHLNAGYNGGPFKYDHGTTMLSKETFGNLVFYPESFFEDLEVKGYDRVLFVSSPASKGADGDNVMEVLLSARYRSKCKESAQKQEHIFLTMYGKIPPKGRIERRRLGGSNGLARDKHRNFFDLLHNSSGTPRMSCAVKWIRRGTKIHYMYTKPYDKGHSTIQPSRPYSPPEPGGSLRLDNTRNRKWEKLEPEVKEWMKSFLHAKQVSVDTLKYLNERGRRSKRGYGISRHSLFSQMIINQHVKSVVQQIVLSMPHKGGDNLQETHYEILSQVCNMTLLGYPTACHYDTENGNLFSTVIQRQNLGLNTYLKNKGLTESEVNQVGESWGSMQAFVEVKELFILPNPPASFGRYGRGGSKEGAEGVILDHSPREIEWQGTEPMRQQDIRVLAQAAREYNIDGILAPALQPGDSYENLYIRREERANNF